MLSIAEIRYLQGQMKVSKSYERKLKCLVKKKVEALAKEIQLLSGLFGDDIQSIFSKFMTEKSTASQLLKQAENKRCNLTEYTSNVEGAIEFSNASLSDVGYIE